MAIFLDQFSCSLAHPSFWQFSAVFYFYQSLFTWDLNISIKNQSMGQVFWVFNQHEMSWKNCLSTFFWRFGGLEVLDFFFIHCIIIFSFVWTLIIITIRNLVEWTCDSNIFTFLIIFYLVFILRFTYIHVITKRDVFGTFKKTKNVNLLMYSRRGKGSLLLRKKKRAYSFLRKWDQFGIKIFKKDFI